MLSTGHVFTGYTIQSKSVFPRNSSSSQDFFWRGLNVNKELGSEHMCRIFIFMILYRSNQFRCVIVVLVSCHD